MSCGWRVRCWRRGQKVYMALLMLEVDGRDLRIAVRKSTL